MAYVLQFFFPDGEQLAHRNGFPVHAGLFSVDRNRIRQRYGRRRAWFRWNQRKFLRLWIVIFLGLWWRRLRRCWRQWRGSDGGLWLWLHYLAEPLRRTRRQHFGYNCKRGRRSEN